MMALARHTLPLFKPSFLMLIKLKDKFEVFFILIFTKDVYFLALILKFV